MIGLFGSAFRQYSSKVEEDLKALFGGFPEHILPSIRKAINVENYKRHFFKDKNCQPSDCAILIARQVVGEVIVQMPQHQKEAAWTSIQSDNPTHPLHIAVGHMNDVAKKIGDKSLVQLLQCEIGGRLQGWSTEQIEKKWTELRVNQIADQITGDQD